MNDLQLPPDTMSMPTPASADPMAPAASDDLGDLPMDREEFKRWLTRVDRARARRKALEDDWQRLLYGYTGRPGGQLPEAGAVETCKTFADVEQKKAQLFYDTPQITLSPQTPLGDGHEEAILVHETILNQLLGRDGVDAKRVVDKALFDVLCTSGLGFTKIGYQSYSRTVSTPNQPGAILNLNPSIQVPVYEEVFWNWFSPKKGLLPDEFRDTDTDQAAWIGMEFSKPLAVARRDYTLPDTFTGRSASDDTLFQAEPQQPNRDGAADLVSGVEIWYRPALFENTGEVHPLLQRRLVILDGLSDRPAKHTASPYQELDARGRLSADSMIGFPVHTFSVRDLSDAAYPLSDAAMTERLNWEENKFRSQMVRIRDAAVPMTFYDEGAVTPETIEKIERGEIGSWHGLEEGKLAAGLDKIVAVAERPELGRENYEAQRVIGQDRNEILAISSVQRGNVNANVVSATEVDAVQQATDVRLAAERGRTVNAFLKGVGKLDSLVQRFGPMTPIPVQIVGPAGVQQWATWDKKTIAGRFLYDIKPDSGVHVDEAQQRTFALKTYEFLRKDPLVNPTTLLRKVAPALHLNPNELIKPPEPPKGPEPNFSYRFGGADMGNPIAVALIINNGVLTAQAIDQAKQLIQAGGNPIVLPPGEPARGLEGAYAQQVGVPIGPSAPHGGLADKMNPMSKHTAALTGERDGRVVGPQ